LGALACSLSPEDQASSERETINAADATTAMGWALQTRAAETAAFTPIAPTPTTAPSTSSAPTAIPPTAIPTASGRVPFTPENASTLHPLMLSAFSGDTVNAMAWAPNSLLMASVSRTGTIYLFNPITNERPYEPISVGNNLIGAMFSPDGFVLAMLPPQGEGTLKLWGMASKGPLDQWNQRLSDASQIAFSPDKLLVASSHPDGIKIWNSNTGEIVQTLHEGPVFGLEFSPDGQALATWGNNNDEGEIVKLWSVETGEMYKSFDPSGLFAGGVAIVSFAPNWKYLVWLSRGSVVLVDLGTGVEVRRFEHEDFVGSASFTPDSKLLATSVGTIVNGQPTPVVRLWNVDTGVAILDQPGFPVVPQVAFSPDGTMLATSDGQQIETWVVGP